MIKKELVLVSGCLAGLKCKYDGKADRADECIVGMVRKGKAILVCPEQLGGLPTPRPPCGIFSREPLKVLTSRGRGEDRTAQFLKGAKETLGIARMFGIKKAILKNKSPSCGVTKTWQLDKNFRNRIAKGQGVTTELLRKNGIEVLSEEDL
ncbi:DUF523 domain-containing protein [candidate division WWE3 bacterium CG09_land_8_20_14_0_10_47_33]|uniref:DUF523 domain-containing protein n=1 Tax=candidate division WWE3 bacterium CG_4_9_14_0_2_um_filter_48_10 TaxID=1975078 RepID=A0A2M8EJM5_UNCKA|nr:MAG: DUF523 domain-containing protein [candidate division WWE3 bacterium CG09_land_8_20_14_0_10_47_33]PIZ40993.1 MAG: DUF523 domain-containing protein [candidate division WWE3 bacterium CG_4_10_14_0_2_um_filter_47_8]PJC22946.1 MAG: DUF523 domain-containing protein [candidate division WWE3 bacterium CG_4_9_14_0_2_um_filter_48_10]PJE52164.1 MAG: hypothetical protein COV28_00865 [candidate division WWE3 bacterium CG10_big_fil_rev_8_21_14_0_10_48_23]